jgi:small nuclear ribonucleoprotein (snRNP)-like protein
MFHPSLIVTGALKGYDQLLNLVLDEVTEDIQGKSRLPIAVSQLTYTFIQSLNRILDH